MMAGPLQAVPYVHQHQQLECVVCLRNCDLEMSRSLSIGADLILLGAHVLKNESCFFMVILYQNNDTFCI